MNNIYAKNNCELFRKISKSVWDKIIFNHSVETEVSEIGLTNDIVATLRNYSIRKGNISIWTNKSKKEYIYGCDLDIFVERTKGKFEWFALQAKVLKTDGSYDFRKKDGDEYQWDKLKRLKSLTKCNIKYLLYNGVLNYKFFGKDNCKKSFQSHQYGCSLVDPSNVEKLILSNSKEPITQKNNNNYIKFEQLHPILAHPWRTITCCNKKIESRLFSSIQINESIKYNNKRITEFDALENYQKLNEEEYGAERELFLLIRTSNENTGRVPKFTIVFANNNILGNSKNKPLQLGEANIEIPFSLNEKGEKEKVGN